MKLKHIFFCGLVIGSLQLATAFAEPGEEGAGGGDPAADKAARQQRIHQKMLEKYDANKDGQLDDAEKAKAKEDHEARKQKRHEAMLKKFDTNGDGKLDDAEKAAMKEQFKAKKAERIKKFDTNGDGKLDDAEKAAAKAACREKHGGKDGSSTSK